MDADINQHLGAALGYRRRAAAGAGRRLGWLKEHLRGTNPRLPRADEMIKTTPPGLGSRLVDLGADDAVLRRFAVATPDGVRLLVAGAFAARRRRRRATTPRPAPWSCTSTTSSTGPAIVVADMTAGADAFASGLFTRFDLTVLVSEPTRRGVGVSGSTPSWPRATASR